jgi:acyl carrier protein
LDNDEIRQTIRQYLRDASHFGDTPPDGSTDLLDGWFVDSIAIVDAVVFLERRFGIKISRRDITADTFRSLDSLVRYVTRRLSDEDRP